MSTSGSGNNPKPELYDLILAHPTEQEEVEIARSTASFWHDALSIPAHLEEFRYLRAAPFAGNGVLTTWILCEPELPPGERHILATCESVRKRALVSNARGDIQEVIVHAIGCVYTPEQHRGYNYAKVLMTKLAQRFPDWQMSRKRCIGTILYSDIGKKYYAKLGWKPNPSNFHIELQPKAITWPSSAKPLDASHVTSLCQQDERALHSIMAIPTEETDVRVSICPDVRHAGWHRAKEEFACNFLFQKVPDIQGAMAGQDGSRVWATWTRRYYGQPKGKSVKNVLYILRLSIEADPTATRLSSDSQRIPRAEIFQEQSNNLRAVLEAAQKEAFEWNLDVVKLWDPTPLALTILKNLEIEHVCVEREDTSVASGLWYNEDGTARESIPLWVNNEHYSWL